jgi:hypothetical protein
VIEVTVVTMLITITLIHTAAAETRTGMDKHTKCPSLTLEGEVHLTLGIQEAIYQAPARKGYKYNIKNLNTQHRLV